MILQKNNLDWEPAYLVFTDEATFYGGPIRNRWWIAPNQSYDISAVKSNIKINVCGAICYSGKIDSHFYKEKTNMMFIYIYIYSKDQRVSTESLNHYKRQCIILL